MRATASASPRIESARAGRSLTIGGIDDAGRMRCSATVGKPTFVGVRLRILNMCPQLVHLTVTPPGFKRLSSSSYSVWHFSQRTSIGFRVLGRDATTSISAVHGLGNPRMIDYREA